MPSNQGVICYCIPNFFFHGIVPQEQPYVNVPKVGVPGRFCGCILADLGHDSKCLANGYSNVKITYALNSKWIFSVTYT